MHFDNENGLREAVGAEEAGRSGSRAREGAARVEDERRREASRAREEEWRALTHAFTQKHAHDCPRTHHTRTQRWWGGKWLTFGLAALLPEK